MEAWLRAHPRRVLLALAGAAVFVRLILCLQVAGGPLPDLHDLWTETDNHFFDVWGRRVASGDLLQRTPLHPMPRWMELVALRAMKEDRGLAARAGIAVDPVASPAEAARLLWDAWLGGPTWFQEPGYPYLVGLTYALAGPGPWPVFAWQLALGVAGVLLVHALARRLFSHTAAAAAAALAVLAPIPLFLELALLRDALVCVVTLGLALLSHWALEGPRRRLLALGLAFGAAALVKQTFLGFPVLVGLWHLATARSTAPRRAAGAALVAAGMALALAPAALRNLLVGVPALAFNGSAAAQLPVFHTADATVHAIHVDPDYVGVLLRSGGSAARALVEAARTHDGPGAFLFLQVKKAAWAWHGFEAPNNVDFYLFRQAAPLLWALPARLVVLVPLAAVGLVRGAARAWPVLVAAAVSLAGVVLATTLSRYRAPLLVALLPLAGAGAVRLLGWAAARRWRPLLAAAAATSLYLAWAATPPSTREPAALAAEHRGAADWFAEASPALAALHLQEALRLAPGDAPTARRLVVLLVASGDLEGALARLADPPPGGSPLADRAQLADLGALAAAGRRAEALRAALKIVAPAAGAGASQEEPAPSRGGKP